MNVLEARRARHLIIRLERGEELPAALLRALDEAEARTAWIEGTGSLEVADIAVFDQSSRTHGKTRRLDGPCDVVSLAGNAAILAGESSLRLSVTLARESDIGLQLSAGELIWARVHALDLHVTAFDDPTLARTQEDRTGLVQSSLQPATATATVIATPPPHAAEPPPRAAPPVTPSASPDPIPPTPPQRPTKPRQEEEFYPEVGDSVTHFAFGECEVISSDGERIRLRQDRDGRVREVSLTMLRIQPPTVDPASSKRHFQLTRKN